MTNYNELSRQEINYLVASVKFADCEELEIYNNIDGSVDVVSQGLTICIAYDPCNNPADAWPIIIENGISIVKSPDGTWGASDLYRNINYWDKNPLRAAMIVFLMMEEEKVDN